MIIPYRGKRLRIAGTVFVAPTAVIIGDVDMAAESSVWFGAVLRGDMAPIHIGPRSNIQDGTIIHVADRGAGTWVGANVTVGHAAILHECRLEDGSMVGMQACVMDGAVVEFGAMVAAGALVTPGKRIPTGELWAGRPAVKLRDLTERDRAIMTGSVERYVALAREYLGG